MIWKPSAGLPHIKIVVGMVLFLFFIWLRGGWARCIGGYLGGRVRTNVCQISASAAVMAITKWSISGSKNQPD